MKTCFIIIGKRWEDVKLTPFVQKKTGKTHERRFVVFSIGDEYETFEEAKAVADKIKSGWGHDAELEIREVATAEEVDKWWDEITEGGTKPVYLP